LFFNQRCISRLSVGGRLLKINLVTKITILALSIFLIAAILIQLLVYTQTRAIIESEQEMAYEQLLDIILLELKRKNQLLETSSSSKAQLDSFKNDVLDDLQQSYLLNNDKHTDIFIVDESGSILLHPHLPRGNRSLAHLFTPTQFAANHGKFFYQDSAGDEQWAFFVRFPEWQWIVCYTVPVQNKIAGFSQFNQHLAFIMGGAFIIMGLALAYFLSKVLQPVSKLTRAANAIAQGYTEPMR
jgi:preprotein translocase subunit SecG